MAVFLLSGLAAPQTFASTKSPDQPWITSIYPDTNSGCPPTNPHCSANWAGYVAYGGMDSVSMVNGSWIQPAVAKGFCKGVKSEEYAMFAVGIDGYPATSDDTVQIGSAAQCTGSSNKPQYILWFEVYDFFLCGAGCPISPVGPVSPGNKIDAFITTNNCVDFSLNITDITTHFEFNTTGVIPSGDGQSCSSAEWLTEASVQVAQPPGFIYPLLDFKVAKYGQAYTGVPTTCFATVSGSTGPIGSFSPNIELLNIFSGGKAVTKTSGLTGGGSSFSVKWK